jgi:hypothetical protein
MKKVLVISSFLVFCLPFVLAQEPAICGDWVGIFEDWAIVNREGRKSKIYKDYKRYIRIKLIDGNFTVRMKTRVADESSPFNYWTECHILETNDRMIKWKMDLGSDYDWTPSAKHKGIPIGHADYFKYCTVILSNGILKYSENMLVFYYDRQGLEIDKEQTSESKVLSLYKDNSDW